jgi:anaerobic selenocysteine-containing dehydrogenase
MAAPPNNLTRREFMRLAGLMGGATLFAGCHFLGESTPVPEYIKGAPAVDPVETLEGIRSVYTVCGLCPGNCGIRCRVAEGVLVKIGGSPYHPVSGHPMLPFSTPLKEALPHGGSVCAIGGSGVQSLYNPFRVARPLKRVGPRGSGKWKALPWNEAIGEIVQGGNLFDEGHVDGLKSISASGQGLAFLAGDVDWGALTFIKGFLAEFPGSELVADRSVMLGQVARDAAEAVFGPGTGPVDADYGKARCVVSFGDAPLDSGIPLVSIARQIADARVGGRGLRWAVVDPRLSTSASKADLWLPVIPGRDMELALGMMRALAEKHRKEFPNDALKQTVMARTLESYSRACGVPAKQILAVADMLADEGSRSAVVPGRGVFGQPDGIEAAKAVLTLNLMVGSVPGSGGLAARDDGFLKQAEKKLLGDKGGDRKMRVYGASVKALILWESDPVYEDPGSAAAYFADREKVPLFVAIDREITETSALADYILPDTTYLERWDICTSPPSVTVPGVGVRSPAVGRFDASSGRYFPILPDIRPMEEIVSHLAADQGFRGLERDAEGRTPTGWRYYQRAFAALLEAMREAGFPLTDLNANTTEVIARGGLFMSHVPPKPEAGAKAVRKAPAIKLPAESAPKDDDSFQMITYSLPFHRSPRAGLNSWLLEVLPENRVMINSSDAAKLKIKSRDRIVVESLDEKTRVQCTAQVVPGLRPGVVAVAWGFGYTQAGVKPRIIDGKPGEVDKTRGTGINPAQLTAQRLIRVKITKS